MLLLTSLLPLCLIISIHTLRGEGDIKLCTTAKPRLTFQSTPSVGRATYAAEARVHFQTHFNPRPPWGGRRRRQSDIGRRHDFNPRPPWGGRRLFLFFHFWQCGISIHALRGEGDAFLALLALEIGNFNPRPPWGGRHKITAIANAIRAFQSTPSVGRATSELFGSKVGIGISIHALRGEGDEDCLQT